jgi:hypothetical protein
MIAQDTRAFTRRDEWRVPDSHNAQVVFLYEFSHVDGTIAFNNRDFAEPFQLQENHLRSIHHIALIKQRPADRPRAL